MRAAPVALAGGADRAAVHLYKAPAEGEADAEPTDGAVYCLLGLGEQLEKPGQHLLIDAYPGIAHANDALLPFS